jgi:probable phosphoglycerate mutase
VTDLPLTDRGERNARLLGERLRELKFAQVFTSPLQRARHTCELAGFGDLAQVDRDLVEWDYGEYEGRRSSEILAERPDWKLFRDGCPGGESPQDVIARADRVVARVRAVPGNVLLFSSGHILRMIAARWVCMDAVAAAALMLGTSSLSALSYENSLAQPAIALWNDVDHLRAADKERSDSAMPLKAVS